MTFNFDSDSPIYLQIVEQVKNQILKGDFKPGDKLPSVREFANLVKVNPNTVQKAFTELERLGFIEAKRTSGRFVCENLTLIKKQRLQQAKHYTRAYLQHMKTLGIENEEMIRLLKEEFEC